MASHLTSCNAYQKNGVFYPKEDMHNLSQLHVVLLILQNLKASVHQFLYLIRVFFSQVRSSTVTRWIHQNVPPKKTGGTLAAGRACIISKADPVLHEQLHWKNGRSFSKCGLFALGF